MRVDGFYVVGRETSGGNAVFMQTYMDGSLPARHWGALKFADRYLVFGDAKKAAEGVPRQYESDGPVAVWRVEVTAAKEAYADV